MGKPRSSTPLNQDAAAYVRMSTEHQQYSTANQMEVIQEFANQRGLDIKIIYSDEGKSGLSIHGRKALTKLIADVDEGQAIFGHILVYDVSRWGRFQDADESAYYEYACRRAGISIHYCAEQFDNDGSPLSTIVKSIKRAMAGEFSRELSTKVFQGQCRLVQLGYRQGGHPGLGYRRMLVGETGVRKGILKQGEHKCIHTDHTILVPGPTAEVKTVRWIFRQFVEERRGEFEIAAKLNTKGVLNHAGRAWNRTAIHNLLTNEKYVGHNVYHRTSCKLRKKHVTNPTQLWVRADDVFKGIVPKTLFEAAAAIFRARSERVTNEEMLNRLRKILVQRGRLSGVLIDQSRQKVTRSALCRRFGCLGNAYSLIGYSPPRSYSYKQVHRNLRRIYSELSAEMRRRIEAMGCTVAEDQSGHIFIINEELRVFITLCRHYITGAGASRWVIELSPQNRLDLIVAARMHPQGDSIRDFYLLPGTEMTGKRLWLAEENGSDWDGYRFSTLEDLCSLFERAEWEEPA